MKFSRDSDDLSWSVSCDSELNVNHEEETQRTEENIKMKVANCGSDINSSSVSSATELDVPSATFPVRRYLSGKYLTFLSRSTQSARIRFPNPAKSLLYISFMFTFV
jgi:hypothetical protein